MKLGSLFDGSGGFPLAGALCDIEPIWASEVEPYPIAVTKSRFPTMKHLGDVSKINGAEIEPVDVLTFGFPCQDVSVAGKRKSVKHKDKGDEETTRSGLVWEAVRIIEEMRGATNGEYPKFAVFENVPGLFSAEKGETFRTVIEGLIKIIEPNAIMPEVPTKGWAYADSFSGDGWSLAYRVFDAQFWGVPQRRRRIYLVADFRGQCAGKILFERQSLRGYFTQSRTEREGTPADVEGSVGADDREGVCYGFPLGFRPENVRCYEETATRAGFCNGVVISAGFKQTNGPKARGIAFGEETAPTLSAGNHDACVAVGLDVYNQALTGDKSKTLNSAATDSDHVPCAVYPVDQGGGKSQANVAEDLSPTLTCTHGGEPVVAYSIENHPNDSRVKIDDEGKVQALTSRMGTGGGNVPMVMETVALEGNGQRPSHRGDGYAETDKSYTLNATEVHGVAYKQQPIAIDRAFFNQGKNALYDPQLYEDGTNPTLVAKGPSAVCTRYIVRRLTPTECARLQGFPDTWGHVDHKDNFTDEEYEFWLNVRNTHAEINGKQVKDYTKKQILTWYNKLHNDGNEYKMWGNGIALPCALYVMQGIAEVSKEIIND